MQPILGVDVGASGIKGAMVDVGSGTLLSERFRLEMPADSRPEIVGDIFGQIVTHFGYQGKVGVGFPSVVKKNVALTAANLHSDWIGCNISDCFSRATGCEIVALNDADAAGAAEMQFVFGNQPPAGTVVFITIGTGLGSAVFLNGKLLPNTEFGHFHLPNGKLAEQYASNAVKKRKELTWLEWGKRFNQYLERLDLLLQPDLIILGGGSSKKFNEYKECISIKTPVQPAKLLNEAGIIGAAVYASQH